MSNKKITQLSINSNPSLLDVFPIVNNGITKQLSLTGLTTFISPFINTGFTTNVKHWLQNETTLLKSDETIVVSGDYVLVDTDLELQKDTEITIGSLTFNKYAQLYIGGNLLLLNSNIVNDGLINVGGAIIFSGNSTITGLGIIN